MTRRYKLKFRDSPGASAGDIAYNGITWNASGFSSQGTFVMGDPYVVGSTTINSVSPAWTGSLNGSMLNPAANNSTQGYNTYSGGTAMTYASGVRQTFPVTLVAGDSLVSTESLAAQETGGASSTTSRAGVLTCLASAPSANTFRPPYVASHGQPQYTTADINWSLLPTLTAPSGKTVPGFATYNQFNNLTLSGTYAYVDTVDDPANSGKSMTTDMMKYPFIDHGSRVLNAAYHPNRNSHSYYYYQAINIMAYKVLVDHAEQEECALRLIQLGLDFAGIAKNNGEGYVAQGGFSVNRKFCQVFAAVMLEDDTLLPDVWANSPTNTKKKYGTDGHTYSGTGGVARWGSDVPAAEGITSPWYGNHDARDPSGNVDCMEGELVNAGAYMQQISGAYTGPALAGNLITGMRTKWAHEPFFDYVDRYVGDTALWTSSGSEFVDDIYGYRGNGSGFCKAMWTDYR